MKAGLNKFNRGQPTLFIYAETESERRLLMECFETGSSDHDIVAVYEPDKLTPGMINQGYKKGRLKLEFEY